jgi:hypothetical protein
MAKDWIVERARNLTESHGYPWPLALDRAVLEHRLREWPQAHGSNLHFLLLGDFQPPANPVRSEALRIEIDNAPQDHAKYGFGALGTILLGKAAMSSIDVPGVLDAVRRINIFLGALTLTSWGNNSFAWWSWMLQVHGGGILQSLDAAFVDGIATAMTAFPRRVQEKIASAMFWIRDPTTSFYERHQRDELRRYAGYWNALECLVDAVCILRPQPKLSAQEKHSRLNALLKDKGDNLAVEDVEAFYREVVNPGLVAKAAHAFSICFPDFADRYVDICFKRKPRKERLYDIRNAINHGEIDAENPEELSRVDYHTSQLWVIVLGLFGRLVPFQAPARVVM